MKKGMVFDTDPGELTMEELKEQMENPDSLPIWKMHPLVQHCLRQYEFKRRGSVEWKSSDASKWMPNPHPPTQMFMEVYRLKAGEFGAVFIRGCTGFNMWKHRSMVA